MEFADGIFAQQSHGGCWWDFTSTDTVSRMGHMEYAY